MQDDQIDQTDQALPRDRDELLRRIDQGWAALERTIGGLTEQGLTARRDAAGWSIKDHLASLAAWERSIAYLLQGRPRHAGLGVPEAVYRTAGDDGINAAIQRQHADRPAAAVLSDLRAGHRHLLGVLAGLTDADLRRTYSHYLPGEPGEETGAPIVGWIVGNTYEHYREHLAWIEALIE
jgi:hypothetical protein